jgi:hypothetical protein
MLLARPTNDTAAFQSATARVIASLLPPGADQPEARRERAAAHRRVDQTAERRQRTVG